MKKHRMYKLYIAQDIVNGIGLIVPIVVLIVAVNLFIEAVQEGFSDIEVIFPCILFTIMGIGFFIMFLSLLGNHYKRIDKVRAVNPALVHEYEEEFVKASDLGNEIWMTDKYCFISDRKDFIVARPDEIKKIRLYVYRTRRGSRYLKLQIIGNDFNANVQIDAWYRNDNTNLDKALNSAQRLVAFSGAEFVNDVRE